MKRKPQKSNVNPGKEYEAIVAAIHQQFADGALVTENEHIIGHESGQPRQIDVAIRKIIVGYDVLLVVDCKDYTRRIDIGKVEELIGVVDDVRAARGILVSDSGFTKGAIKRANGSGRIVLVSVIDTKNTRLSAIIALPVRVCLHDLHHPITIHFAVSPKCSEDELCVLARLHFPTLVRGFFEWCAANAAILSAGQHEHTLSLPEMSERKVVARFTFMKTIRCFIKRDLFVEAKGIYDHSSRKLLCGSESTQINIDPEEVMKSWVKWFH